jgi:hypothetical protein
VRDRYEDKVAHTLVHACRSSQCGSQLFKQHERSNMWYQRELIKNTYSTTAYAGLTAMRDLPRFIVYHSDVMLPYYKRWNPNRDTPLKSRQKHLTTSSVFLFYGGFSAFNTAQHTLI